MSQDSLAKLRSILLAEDFGACAEFFEDMPETERRSFVKPIVAMAREFRRRAGEATNVNQWQKFEAAANATDVAILATGTLGALKQVANRNSFWLSGKAQTAAHRILDNRRPAWLSHWCDHLLERDHFLWGFVRRLEQAGLCEPQRSDRYVLGMAGCLVGKGHARLSGLRDNPEFLESLVWRLFEIEGFWEDRAWENKRYRTEENSWAFALRELSKSGELDRVRLLDASLDALKLDFRDIQAGWYRFFHDYMEPSFEERVSRADRYLDLAIGPNLPTASFAMKSLLAIHKRGALGNANFVRRIEPALYAPTKAIVNPALKILAEIAESEPTLRSEIVRVAAKGLEHKMPDLQETSMAIIEQYGDTQDPELREIVDERLALIPVSLKRRTMDWLGREPGTEQIDPPPGQADIQALVERALAVSSEPAQRAGLGNVLHELEELTGYIPPVELPVPWLSMPEPSGPAIIDGILFRLRHYFGEPKRNYINEPIYELMAEARERQAERIAEKGPLYEFVWYSTELPRFTPDIRKVGPDDPICPLTIGLLCYYIEDDDGTTLLISAIEDGRIGGKEIGLTLRRMLFKGEIKPNHKAPQLELVAEESPLHRQVVLRLLEYALGGPAGAKLPHNVHLFMELLFNLCVEAEEAVTDPECRAFLQGIDGTGKAAKLAKKLLALAEGDPLPHRRAAAAVALRGRLERAKRWAETGNGVPG